MRILIHATLYPEWPEDKRPNTTMFMHYYAAEWVKLGCEVLVIHHKVVFPRALVAVLRALSRTKLPGMGKARDYLNGYGEDGDAEFARDGVKIVRASIAKPLPRMLFPRRAIEKRARLVRSILAKEHFEPDVVIADFMNPGLFVARAMGARPLIFALHDTDAGYFTRPLTRKGALDAARGADCVAFRNELARKRFEKDCFTPQNAIFMPSGLPRDVADAPVPAKRTRVRAFLTAGRMVPLKRMEAVIEAFGGLTDPDVTLALVGDGVCLDELRNLAARMPNKDRIRFTGRLSREATLAEMGRADCFALLSEHESFGMVYVEAMSRGAIPAATRGQSGESFVRDGENGFLAPAGDANALRAIMEKLISMPEAEVARLSGAAMETVSALRDDVLARNALAELERLKEICT